MNPFIVDLLAWKKGFERGRSVLEKQRIERIRESNIIDSLESFDKLFESAMQRGLPRSTTGLVELQEVLSKIRR